MTDIDSGIHDGAVNVYQNDMADEFPVLKAFQQYIDAEQAKSRKRMLLLCVFFCFVLTAVIAVFFSLLLASSSRNQNLYDRLIEFAMKDRERTPVVAQTTPRDDTALRALTDKLETLQKTIADDRARAGKAAAETAVKNDTRPSVEALEIERLKALLAAEKEKAAAEREKQRQAELEAYRRKHYPELYGQKPDNGTVSKATARMKALAEEEAAADREIESIVNEIKAIEYFDDDEEEDSPSARRTSSKKNATRNGSTPEKKDPVPDKNEVVTPRGVEVSSGSTWSIPEE